MDKHNSCINSRAIIHFIEEKCPSKLPMLFEDLGPEMDGIQDPRAFLTDPHNWISSGLMITLFERAKKIAGQEDVAYHIGFNSILKQRLGYIQRILLYAFGNPAKLVQEIQRVNDHFNKTKTIELVNYSKREAVVRLLWNKEVPLSKDFCLMNKGIYQAIPMIWGLPPSRLVETKCFFNGDSYCEYQIHWEEKSFFKSTIQRLFLPWKVAKESIQELERDKEALKEKYNQIYQLNQELQQKIDQLTTLQESSTAILSTLKLEELLDVILLKLLKVANLDRAGIFLTDQEKHTLTLIHAVGIEHSDFLALKGYKIPLSKTDNIIARTANSREPVIVEDVTRMNLNPENPLLKRLKPKAFILVPLTVRGQMVGIMVGDNHTNNRFLRGIDKGFLTSFANHIAMALDNATLYNKLETSEKRYREIVENVNEGIWILDANGKIKFTNRHLSEMFDHQNLIGRSVYSLVDHNMRKKLLHILMENISGRPAKDEITLKKEDGEDLQVLLSSVPLKKENGQFEGCLSMIADLTDKKRMENKLLQAQKLESVGTMAGGIAHDFNNILTGILGYVMLLKQRASGDPVCERYLSIIEKSGLRAADLVKKLLAFSRGSQPGQAKPSDLNSIVQDTVELLKSSISKNISIQWSFSPENPFIRCDPTQIQQSILNICLNARDAMPEGGELKLFTKVSTGSEIKKLYGFEAKPNAQYAQIAIQDTGTGIPAKDLERIFDPFFTTKEVGKGSGLGLAMVYGIVKGSGGFIHVDSKVGKGTCFRLFFPVSNEEEITQDTSDKDRSLEGHETILVVDDEDVVRDLTTELLESHGYNVLEAKDGLEALHIYEAMGHHIHLVILDVVMPKLGGTEAYQQLKKINPQIRVIFCSGHGMDEDMVREVLEKGLPFAQKPFKLDELLKMVREVLDQ